MLLDFCNANTKKFKVGQVVRDDGPKEHLKKQGTPTMGGIIMLIVIVVILAINSIKYPTLILAIISILGFGLVGFVDDYKKLVKKILRAFLLLKNIWTCACNCYIYFHVS